MTTRTPAGLVWADVRRLNDGDFGAAVETAIIWGLLTVPLVWILYGCAVFVLNANRRAGADPATGSHATLGVMKLGQRR